MNLKLTKDARQLPTGKIAIALVILILLYNSFFVVKPSDEAGVRWLGGTVITKQPLDTGLHFKVPFLEDGVLPQVVGGNGTLPMINLKGK